MTSQTTENEIRRIMRDWPARFQAYAQPDRRKAIIQMLNTFLPFLGLWVLMYFSIGWSYWITLGLAVVNAFFMVRIFIIQHDCGHRSFLGSQRWNQIVGTVCCFFSSIPFAYWAREHEYHHGHNGQLEVRTIGDIWLLTEAEYTALPRWRQHFYRLYRSPFVTFIIGPLVYLVVNNRFEIVKLPGWQRIHRAMHWQNVAILAVYVGVGWLVGWQRFLLVQLPILAIFSIISVWFFYVQHQHEDAYKQWYQNWDYLLSAIKGSTYYRLPRVFHWLTGSIAYHHIHHLNSKIPNYNLAKAHNDHPYLERYITTVGFVESLTFMRHKLWSEEEQRMITFREYRERQQQREQRA